MTTTYYLRNVNSDLTGGADFSYKLMSASDTESTTAISIAKASTEISYGFTEPATPNNNAWETGGFTVTVKITSGNQYIYLAPTIRMVSAAGVVRDTADSVAEQQLTNAQTYTFNIPSKTWIAATVGDRIRIGYNFRNAKNSAQSVTVSFNTSGTTLVSPIVPNKVATSITQTLQYKVIKSKTLSTLGLTYAFTEDYNVLFSHCDYWTIVNPTTKTNYQHYLEIDWQSGMQSDFRDIRFAQVNNTHCSYWIESYVDGVSAIVWVKVPLANQIKLKMYYGNASVASMSDGDNTFILFDHFEGSSLNATKWTGRAAGAQTCSVADSLATLNTNAGGGYRTTSAVSVGDWISIEAKLNQPTQSTSHQFGLINSAVNYGGWSSWYHNSIEPSGGKWYASSYESLVEICDSDANDHRFKLKVKAGAAGTGWVDSSTADCVNALSASSVYFWLIAGSSSVTVIDWVFSRQWSATEPTVIPCTVIEQDLMYMIAGQPNWFDWQRDTISISHEVTISEYQHKIDLVWHEGINTDFSDIRFTQENLAPLYHYIDPDSLVDGVSCTVWVRVRDSYQTTLYMYHCGDPAETSTSDGDAVFEFIDDFEGVALDTTKWDVVHETYDTGTATVSGGKLSINVNRALAIIQKITPLPSDVPIITECYANLTQGEAVDWNYGLLMLPGEVHVEYNCVVHSVECAGFGSSGTSMDYRDYDTSQDYGQYFDATAYNLYQIILTGTGNTTALYYVNGGYQASHTVTFHPYIAIGAYTNASSAHSHIWVNWVRARKYVAIEPTLEVTLAQGAVTPDLQYAIKAQKSTTHTLEYVINDIPTWIIEESLQYTVPSTHQLTESLEYIAVHRFTSQLTLGYTITGVHSTTESLQYVVPHLEIEAVPPVTGRVPINIGFIVTSQSDIGTDWEWTWTFDGDAGTTTTPATTSCVHQFVGYGEYDVECTAATTGGGATGSVHISLVEDLKPVALFYMDKTTGTFPLTVTFYNYSSGAVSYDWDFGDGTAHSSDTNPVHVYTVSDDYTVTLTATNVEGDSTYVDYITATYVTPVADFEIVGLPTQIGQREVTVTLDIEDVNGVTDNASKDVMISPGPFTVFRDLSVGSIKHWEWSFGDEHGSIRSKLQHPSHSYDYYGWTLVSDSPSWGTARAPGLVRMSNGDIVLLGGIGSTSVWRTSNNGVSWVQETTDGGWVSYGLANEAVVLSDDTIVIVTTDTSSLPFVTTVWDSDDYGATWNYLSAFPARIFHNVVRLADDTILVLGGENYVVDDYVSYNDIWKSEDGGSTWDEVTAAADWDARYAMNTVVLSDDTIVLLGGFDQFDNTLGDVWTSVNGGVDWTEVSSDAEWGVRAEMTSVVLLNDDIIMMSGYGSDDDDVWRSVNNGATWTLETLTPGWIGRFNASAVTLLNGDVLLLGGFRPYDTAPPNGPLGDIWRWYL